MFTKKQRPENSTQPETPATTPAGHSDLARPPAWAGGKPLRARLKINRPGDADEQEAERVADEVVRMPDTTTATSATPRIQRRETAPGGGGDTAPESVNQTLRQPGQPLDSGTQQYMESRFGADFSDVRVHTDAEAAQSAADIQAQAYTVGPDIVFGDDYYQPTTADGRRLLAHELTHVLQQPQGGEMLRRNGEDEIENEVTQRSGQVQNIGGIQAIGPAVTIESDWTSSVTGHMHIRWELWEGRAGSGTLTRRGEFLSGGLVDGMLARGSTYTLRMVGSISVRENNMVFNNAFNGTTIAAEWLLHPRETSSGGSGGGSDDPAAELIAVPVMRPMSDPLTPDRSDWNIVVQDITRSRSDSAQVGLAISWTKSGSRSSEYGGTLDLGGGVEASASRGTSINFADGATLFAAFRFQFYTFSVGPIRIVPSGE